MKTKRWKLDTITPAGGYVYHKNGVNDIMVVYHYHIRLYKDIHNVDGQEFVPAHATDTLTRKIR